MLIMHFEEIYTPVGDKVEFRTIFEVSIIIPYLKITKHT